MKTPRDLFLFLEQLQIKATHHKHEPVFTVAEGLDVKKRLEGAHTKNLFLKTKKDFYCLVSMLDDKQLDLTAFAGMIGRGRFSFASPDRLKEKLGLEPGSVTPFGVIHPQAEDVSVVLDADMMAYERINFHPLRNDMSTTIRSVDFLRFLEALGHTPKICKLPKVAPCS